MNGSPHILPEEFGIGSSDTLIYFYSNSRSSTKNKVIFTKNLFCFLQQGCKEVQTAGSKELIHHNETLILTSGSTLMSESVADNGRYEAILLFFDNKILTDFCVKNRISTHPNVSPKSVLKVENDEFIEHYCRSLQLIEKSSTPAMTELKVQEILCYLWTERSSVFQEFVSQALAGKSDIKLRQVIELNSNKGATIEELAFLCNMSVSTFKRRFADNYQMSPQKYFNQKRMEYAKSLLLINRKATEIYMELGYENLSAFSNEFKKHTGLSPRQYQEENGLTQKVSEPLG